MASGITTKGRTELATILDFMVGFHVQGALRWGTLLGN
jgi:hypothetical protein